MAKLFEDETIHDIVQAKSDTLPETYNMALSTVDFAAVVNALRDYYDSSSKCEHDCAWLVSKFGNRHQPCAHYVYDMGMRELAGGVLAKIADSLGVRYDRD